MNPNREIDRMQPTPSAAVSPRDKIDVLLQEYNALRAEIVARLKNRFMILGYVGAIVTYAVFQHEVPLEWRAGFAALAGLALLVTWLRGMQMIGRIARRIARIETRVNELAGEALLTWESSQVGRSWLDHLFRR
jgi:hypothetical protein